MCPARGPTALELGFEPERCDQLRAGGDTALETADVALMGDDLSRLGYLYRLSRASRGVIRQNIGASLFPKLGLAAGVPLGLVSLIVAVVVGDMGASLGVTANALRLANVRV